MSTRTRPNHQPIRSLDKPRRPPKKTYQLINWLSQAESHVRQFQTHLPQKTSNSLGKCSTFLVSWGLPILSRVVPQYPIISG